MARLQAIRLQSRALALWSEQAMAQRGCGPDEAFNVLRQVSQRTNVKLHVLAAQLVKVIPSSKDGGNVTPITLGVGRDLLP